MVDDGYVPQRTTENVQQMKEAKEGYTLIKMAVGFHNGNMMKAIPDMWYDEPRGGTAHAIGVTSYLSQVATGRQASGQLRTPMMGMILKIHVAVGERVRSGDVVATMESMKMEMRINADHDGVVRSLSVQPGQMVERGLVVAVVESEGAAE